MHALKGGLNYCLLALTAIFLIERTSASLAVRRAAITESALNPWVSIDPSGQGSTVIPVLTTVNGVATTLNAAPTTVATTTIASGGSLATATTIGPAAAATAGGSLQVCHNIEGDLAPFCTPENGASLNIGDSYYVTWDSSFFNSNETLYIHADYVNATGGGPQAFSSAPTSNNWGWISITIQPEWLKGQSSNNLSVYIAASLPRRIIQGPFVIVEDPNAQAPYQQPPTPVPKGRDLYIALPTIFAFIVLCLCGGYIFNRKARHIGLGNVMGRRKGYGAGKSRRQRLGLGKKSGAIQLREQELTADGQYRDTPIEQHARVPEHGHRRNDSDGLDSLVGSPTEEGRGGENIFRDEMRRQERERS